MTQKERLNILSSILTPTILNYYQRSVGDTVLFVMTCSFIVMFALIIKFFGI